MSLLFLPQRCPCRPLHRKCAHCPSLGAPGLFPGSTNTVARITKPVSRNTTVARNYWSCWRATSSHLHVVSAGNSQRNSLAVSECQEELNNAIFPLFTPRWRAENRVSEPYETPNITEPVQRGSRAPSHVRPYDGSWTLPLH
ncbi:hypothetical protein BO71DRAFT_92892 [Aspergillus ellipticus CBS 707.79]|uniref:Uncharacterized protein n=1 Tax=Aspergillus ellipticus CBS 707.79 TaxID=1448320 RepID=A0A319DG33_9EURO|nr:hypothetical protein BO71DRAFT_92892 [Aspergillus ellipticus CBS 707.79]